MKKITPELVIKKKKVVEKRTKGCKHKYNASIMVICEKCKKRWVTELIYNKLKEAKWNACS